MANLSSIYIKRETLKTLLDVAGKKDLKGIEITVSTNDETNEWEQNVSAFVAQSKEEREAKKKRFYVGNGKVFWTDGKITVADKKEDTKPATVKNEDVDDDLPF